MNRNQLEVIHRRWTRNGETVQQMYRRVANAVGKTQLSKATYYHLLSSQVINPNSPCMTGAGTGLGNLSACFVLPLVDDMGKEPNGIFDTLKNAALIQQSGGGIGFDFSALRPEGSTVSSSGGVSSGPIGFMRVYNTAFEEISQGGIRRGANIAVMNVRHPDIIKFIRCKHKEGELTNFNISVSITDDFMDAVDRDENWKLFFRNDDKYFSRPDIPAKAILRMISEGAYRNGEPGVIFIDRMSEDNPFGKKYTAVNPCSEMPLMPFESCNLGHLDLRKYCGIKDGKRVILWDKLRMHIEEIVSFLDDVIDVNRFVPAIPQLREVALRNRRIGLGIMGLADMLYFLRIRYGSNRAVALAYQLMEFIRYYAMFYSSKRAMCMGVFPSFMESVYKNGWEPKKKPDWIEDYDFGRPNFSWGTVLVHIEKHGLRNSSFLTIAPTGTTGTVAGVEGYGCEPVFALQYTRFLKENGEDIPLVYTSTSFKNALQDDPSISAVRRSEIIRELYTGSCQNIDGVPDWMKQVFVIASDLSPEEHIRMQAALQVHIDSAISKTISCPDSITVDEIESAIKYAYRLGCKGLTLYVDGSRNEVVLKKNVCPECGSDLIEREGCKYCEACGWGACSV